MVSKCPIF